MGVIAESDLDPETVLHPATSHPGLTLHAIATPDAPTAERLASRFHFAKAYGSRTALLDDPTIAAVFVSAPIGLRFSNVELALRKGKHVLCESPLAANANEVKILVDLAKEMGAVLLEGVRYDVILRLYRQDCINGSDGRNRSIGSSIQPRMHGANLSMRANPDAFFTPRLL
ncbi:hypothetical protein N7474_003803 [Penicillium riverlandense]|uniref:uncharacterized protein n=1 Tax=Penicillium riverlandense TaxID=1903569 RepID=UPI002547F56E|nr:uncharacterized protein N7474_003803 [Penicillium riverlandense]KAJ5818212.1 hypothetical protein N7474_003803 [Penicillium riverlandense]